eukprot:6173059-Pleurochrysis_carterae.AAC.1
MRRVARAESERLKESLVTLSICGRRHAATDAAPRSHEGLEGSPWQSLQTKIGITRMDVFILRSSIEEQKLTFARRHALACATLARREGP